MRKDAIGFLLVCLVVCASFFGCSATESEKIAARKRYPDRFVQRTVSDYQGKPFLSITCEYIGRQPYEGYATRVPWQTKEFVFYNFRFENLTRRKITFISKKVYQKDARNDRNGMAEAKTILAEFADFSKQPHSDFDRLEPQEVRKLINQAFRADDNPSHAMATIVLQIQYLDHDYTFNIRLHNTR